LGWKTLFISGAHAIQRLVSYANSLKMTLYAVLVGVKEEII